jgi:hypothetical protein
MSVPQGSTPLNTQYFTSLQNRAQACSSCAQLQGLYTEMNISVGATQSAMTSQLAAVQTQVTNVASQMSTLYTHIASLAAAQTSMTAVGTVGATAAAVSDLGSCIAYVKAQGLTLVSLGSTNTLTFINQALALEADYTSITQAYSLITNQLANLTAQISGIGAQLTATQGIFSSVASRFPSCTL